jgi:hypothetical protein
MKQFALICVLLATLLIGRAIAGDTAAAEKAAVEAAEAGLKLIDDGKYADSWKESAGFFKKAITQEKWIASLKAVRDPLGKKLSREVLGKKHVTQLPGAPPGEYVIIQFKTSFENKKSAIETYTPMLDKDGKWRMSGYYIK